MTRRFAPDRLAFAGASVLVLLYCANVALRIGRIKFGASVWSVGDVGEFLLVLSCMVCFVVGLLVDETNNPKPNGDAIEPTTGEIR